VSLLGLLAPLFPDLDRSLTSADSRDTIESWDSFKHAEIVIVLEEEYGVRLSTADIVKMTSISSMTEVLRGHGVGIEP